MSPKFESTSIVCSVNGSKIKFSVVTRIGSKFLCEFTKFSRRRCVDVKEKWYLFKNEICDGCILGRQTFRASFHFKN